MLGLLASTGIEKGKPCNRMEWQKTIFEQAALADHGLFLMCR
jgi:hypothetical protein